MFEEPASVRLVRELISGLCHIHALNIIHLDIKPGNLFLTGTGSLQIMVISASARDHPPDIKLLGQPTRPADLMRSDICRLRQ